MLLGETANIMLTSVFGAIAVIAAGITIVIVGRWRSASGALSSHGPGVISDAERKQVSFEL